MNLLRETLLFNHYLAVFIVYVFDHSYFMYWSKKLGDRVLWNELIVRNERCEINSNLNGYSDMNSDSNHYSEINSYSNYYSEISSDFNRYNEPTILYFF